MTANWFADGQHVLTLAGGALVLASQGLTIWRTTVIGQRQTVLHSMVSANDTAILGELSTAQKSLDNVVAAISGHFPERRRNVGTPPPTWANGGRGNRATDAPPAAT